MMILNCAGRTPYVVILTWIVFQGTCANSDDPNVIATVDVAPDGDFLLVPFVSEETTYKYILDTGASVSAVALETATKWKPERLRILVTDAGEKKVPVYRRPEEGFVAGLTLRRGIEVTAFDLRYLSELSGNDIDGVLGMNDLGRFILQIDYDGGILRFLRSAKEEEEYGEKFRFSTHNGIPQLMLTVGGSKFLASIDTGGLTELALPHDSFDLLVENGDIQLWTDIRNETKTVTGPIKAKIGTLRELQLGHFKHSNLGVTQGRKANLGAFFLARYLVTVDFPKQAIYLKPGKNYDRPPFRDKLGINPIRRNKQIVINVVGPSSPAHAAGIREGDVLRQVNGRDAANESLFNLRRLFCQGGKTMKLQIEREGQLSDLSITLAGEENVSGLK